MYFAQNVMVKSIKRPYLKSRHPTNIEIVGGWKVNLCQRNLISVHALKVLKFICLFAYAFLQHRRKHNESKPMP